MRSAPGETTSIEAGPAKAAGPLSHARLWRAGIVQSVSAPGVFDLGPGYLEPGLLPVDLLKAAYARAMEEYGSAALGYGDDRGALDLRAALADRAAVADGIACEPGNVLVTAGISHALQLIATTLAAPGSLVLVEETCYDLGRLILTDCGLRPREVRSDSEGMDPDALRDALAEEQAAFVYLNPTFHNPTGRVVPVERRRELLAVTARHGTPVIEDDAYAELNLDGKPTPPSMAGLAGYHGVIRLRTFSKTLAPGLRLGWLLAGTPMIDRLAGHGLFRSGGCLNHTSALAMAALLRAGDYDRHLGWLRERLRERRDTLVDSLLAGLGDDFELDRPDGGFFVWLRALRRYRECDLLAAASGAGVEVAAGSRFGGTVRPAVRMAYSFNSPPRLAAAAQRLTTAWHAVPAHTDRT
ncbi:aminotransferase class I/II-fold pyridoxal phosphate-dependent enzyme [Streptosporangium sp. NPDC006930]|uniref:aminotransferase class I/II-fold pyridoxal phosphate-dependent enzyme n=1 Tax=unclassified Streptosporangium TaxID=2632669 RepID=UPI00343860AA